MPAPGIASPGPLTCEQRGVDLPQPGGPPEASAGEPEAWVGSPGERVLSWEEHGHRSSRIWSGPRQDAESYIAAVDALLQSAAELGASGRSSGSLGRALKLLHVAMARLETEFLHILLADSASVDPVHIYEAVAILDDPYLNRYPNPRLNPILAAATPSAASSPAPRSRALSLDGDAMFPSPSSPFSASNTPSLSRLALGRHHQLQLPQGRPQTPSSASVADDSTSSEDESGPAHALWTQDDDPGDSDDEDEDERRRHLSAFGASNSGHQSRLTLPLLPDRTIASLQEISTRMANAGKDFSSPAHPWPQYARRMCHAYSEARRAVVEESLDRLGAMPLAQEQLLKLPWPALEKRVISWLQGKAPGGHVSWLTSVQYMGVAVRVLLGSERHLCEQVMVGAAQYGEVCFAEVAKSGMRALLGFSEAVATGKRSPEKLFRILEMCEVVRDLLPAVESVFRGHPCQSLREEAHLALQRLNEAARSIFAKFENAIERDATKTPAAGGGVHPLTRYVVNYLVVLYDYRKTLRKLFSEDAASIALPRVSPSPVVLLHDSDICSHALPPLSLYPSSFNVVLAGSAAQMQSTAAADQSTEDEYLGEDETEDEDDNDAEGGGEAGRLSEERNAGPSLQRAGMSWRETPTRTHRRRVDALSASTMWKLHVLHSNLDMKSRLYREPALSSLFLMNNIQYMTMKVRASELQNMVGPEWLERHESMVRQYAEEYLRCAWGRVLASLKEEGLQNHSHGGASGPLFAVMHGAVSRNILKERLRQFNNFLEEAHRAHISWVIPDPQLRETVRQQITSRLVPTYRAFCAKYGGLIENGRHPDKYLRFQPADVERIVGDLFQASLLLRSPSQRGDSPWK
eukprot:SM000020S05958  [mRNA]  locus=s20:82341:85897:- [translate_table: standard]